MSSQSQDSLPWDTLIHSCVVSNPFVAYKSYSGRTAPTHPSHVQESFEIVIINPPVSSPLLENSCLGLQE